MAATVNKFNIGQVGRQAATGLTKLTTTVRYSRDFLLRFCTYTVSGGMIKIDFPCGMIAKGNIDRSINVVNVEVLEKA